MIIPDVSVRLFTRNLILRVFVKITKFNIASIAKFNIVSMVAVLLMGRVRLDLVLMPSK